jgi:hypothetical protein
VDELESSQQFERLVGLIQMLRDQHIHFDLSSIRSDSILVSVVVPGECWEVEFMSAGTLEIEVFRSDGSISGHDKVGELFRAFGSRADARL